MRTLALLGLFLLQNAAPDPAPAGAGTDARALGYVHASSHLQADEKPALYAPLNLIDLRPASPWCEGSPGDGVGERIWIGFKHPVRIDSLRIANGDGRTPTAWRAHNRVHRLVIREEGSKRTVTLADRREPQVVQLVPPIEAERLELEVVDVVRGSGEDDATCLSEIVFYDGDRPLDAEASALRFDRGRARYMGRWSSGPKGAPDRFLDFFADGTLRYVRQPFDPDEPPVELAGEYRWDGEALQLKVGAARFVDARAHLDTRAARDGTARAVLTIRAEELAGSLGGVWTDPR